MKNYSMYMLKTGYFHTLRGVLFSGYRETLANVRFFHIRALRTYSSLRLDYK